MKGRCKLFWISIFCTSALRKWSLFTQIKWNGIKLNSTRLGPLVAVKWNLNAKIYRPPRKLCASNSLCNSLVKADIWVWCQGPTYFWPSSEHIGKCTYSSIMYLLLVLDDLSWCIGTFCTYLIAYLYILSIRNFACWRWDPGDQQYQCS